MASKVMIEKYSAVPSSYSFSRKQIMESEVIVVYANKELMPDIANLKPHQTYQKPTIDIVVARKRKFNASI